jgi:hypothetical protein
MPVHLPKFDSSRDFVAQRNFMFDGQRYMRGTAFPNDSCTERKLEQLYETRHIGYAGDEQVKQIPPRSPRERAARERLAERGVDTSLDARADALQKKHTRSALEKLGGPDMKAELAKLPNKTEVAKALIAAGKAGDDGTA